MCFLEFNWTAGVWSFRIGHHFTDFQGARSWSTLNDAREFFKSHGCKLVKTDSRTFRVDCASVRDAAAQSDSAQG